MAICPDCGRRWTYLQPPKYIVTNAGAQIVERLCYKRMVEVYKSDGKARCMKCLDSWLLKESLKDWDRATSCDC